MGFFDKVTKVLGYDEAKRLGSKLVDEVERAVPQAKKVLGYGELERAVPKVGHYFEDVTETTVDLWKDTADLMQTSAEAVWPYVQHYVMGSPTAPLSSGGAPSPVVLTLPSSGGGTPAGGTTVENYMTPAAQEGAPQGQGDITQLLVYGGLAYLAYKLLVKKR